MKLVKLLAITLFIAVIVNCTKKEVRDDVKEKHDAKILKEKEESKVKEDVFICVHDSKCILASFCLSIQAHTTSNDLFQAFFP